jgi:hypothetical protein
MAKTMLEQLQRAQKFQQRSDTRLRFIDVKLMPASVDYGHLGTRNRVGTFTCSCKGVKLLRAGARRSVGTRICGSRAVTSAPGTIREKPDMSQILDADERNNNIM